MARFGEGPGDVLLDRATVEAQVARLAQQLQAQKRFDGRQVTLKAGWQGLQIATGTLVVDRYAPSNAIYGVYLPEIARHVGLDFTWSDDDGRVLIRSSGVDAVEAYYKGYMNLNVTNRNSHVRIDIAEPDEV